MGGTEVPIQWNGRPARAWLPDPIAARDLDLPVDAARATERAAAAVRRVGDRSPGRLGTPRPASAARRGHRIVRHRRTSRSGCAGCGRRALRGGRAA